MRNITKVDPLPKDLEEWLIKKWCEYMGVKSMSKKIRHKFGAKPQNLDGIRFDSKAEAQYYQKLKIAQRTKELLFFLRQVPFHLPGGVKYVVDFQEFWADGNVVFTDVKGMETPEFKTKKKLVESLYPITINVVKV